MDETQKILTWCDRRIGERLLQFQRGAGGGPSLGGSVVMVGGTAGGDLSGTYPNPEVHGLYGVPIYGAAPSDGEAMLYDAANGYWKPGPGGLSDHAHSGADGTSKLAQANTHESADTDAATSSIHHTIGATATTAAAGNHAHATRWEPVTNGDPASPEVLFVDGDIVMVEVSG